VKRPKPNNPLTRSSRTIEAAVVARTKTDHALLSPKTRTLMPLTSRPSPTTVAIRTTEVAVEAKRRIVPPQLPQRKVATLKKRNPATRSPTKTREAANVVVTVITKCRTRTHGFGNSTT